MALLMQPFELFGRFVELNLSGLGLSYLLLEFLAFAANFDGKFLDLEGELLDFGLVSTTILLQSQVILFLLAGGEGPLLEFLLVPVHFKFELIHALVGFENHILDVVQPVLLISNSLL